MTDTALPLNGKIDSNPRAASPGSNFNDEPVKLLELRNYLMRPGKRDEFIQYFEENFINSQKELGSYVLGRYRVKGAEDNFFWMRGFKDMPARYKFLNEFYFGPFWKAHKTVPNSLLLNNDNVYLLKPLAVGDSSQINKAGFSSAWFGRAKGITVIDFYTSNTKLDKLIVFVRAQYDSILRSAGVTNTTFWVSETTPNDFTALPVFQDKNLLVQITFYENEADYQAKIKTVHSKMNDTQKTDMADLVTIRNTLVLYPTQKSQQ